MGITARLRYGFGALTLLIVCLFAAWLFFDHSTGQGRRTIRTSLEIERSVLDMDRLLEKSRRLHGEFFLHYARIGLTEAHVQFAQPSVRLVAEAIRTSAELKKTFERSVIGQALATELRGDLNFYLASAKRFADTSIASIELITKLAAPEQGLEANFSRLMQGLRAEAAAMPPLQNLSRDLLERYQEYRISRQRHAMQAVFNSLAELEQQIKEATALDADQATRLQSLTQQLRAIGEEILIADLEIKNIFNDFNIQSKNIGPVAQVLVQRIGEEVRRLRLEVDRTLQFANVLFGLLLGAAMLGGLAVVQWINRSVTRRIHDLTEAALRLQEGDFDIVVTERPADELGHLGKTFNMMSRRIRELVSGLEDLVAQRTAQLAGSEQRFRLVANELPNVGIIGLDRARRIVFWNRTCERLYGWTGTEALGRSIETLAAEGPEREAFRESLRGWIEQGRPIPSREAVFCHRDGTAVQVYVSHFLVTATADDYELFSLHIDLADLKRAQEETLLKESLYRSLFEHTSSGVGICEAVDEGRDFVIKDVNPAGETIEGRSRATLVGRRVTEVFPGVVAAGMLEAFTRVWRSGQPVVLPPTIFEDGDRQRWLQSHVYRIPSGEIVHVYDDVTRLRETELAQAAMEARLEQSRKMEAIGLLAGGVAHDLNNILSGIVGYPEILLSQVDEHSRLRKPLLAIQASGQRAAAVVADLLTLARGVSSERRPCDLNRLIEDYLASPEHEATLTRHPGVQCRFLPAAALWPLSCSEVHVRKSLMNLVTNAAEAIAQAGQIVIRTRNEFVERDNDVKTDLQPGRYVVLEVADTGSGIATKDIDHIFEPFYTRKVMGRSGTGLGLAIVWNAMQDHRGGVKVHSSGQGTQFCLYFPAAAEAFGAEEVGVEQPLTEGAGERILVVDDEPFQRDIATQYLTMLGYAVESSASGEEAVALLQQRRVDLVLLDMCMGKGMNGRQTYEAIVALHPGQKALIVSGFAEDEEVGRTLELGGSGYLQKPYTLNRLSQAVHVALHSRP